MRELRHHGTVYPAGERMSPTRKPTKPGQGGSWEQLRARVTPALLSGIALRIVGAFKPERVILFGSHAYGTPRPESDVDLMVIMPTRQSMARRIMSVAAVAEVPFLPMDVLVFTPREIRERLRLRDPFITEVLTKGRVLYRRGAARRMGRKSRR